MHRHLAILAIATAISTPALANQTHRVSAMDAYASTSIIQPAPRAASAGPVGALGYADAYAVYEAGEYRGSDPDPSVRQQLRKDDHARN